MLKKVSSQRPAFNSSEQVDRWLLAIAFVISHRQMRGRRTSLFMSA
jgi:hypothetical protein